MPSVMTFSVAVPGGFMIPTALPFQPIRSGLYTSEELCKRIDLRDPLSFTRTTGARGCRRRRCRGSTRRFTERSRPGATGRSRASIPMGEHPYVYLEGIVLKRSWAGEARNVSLLVAIGVNGEGYREILGICEGAKEDKAGWSGSSGISRDAASRASS
jgi:hypothetical protein